MAAGVELEWCIAGGRVNRVIDAVFDEEEVFFPVVLVEIDKVAKGCLNKIVFNF